MKKIKAGGTEFNVDIPEDAAVNSASLIIDGKVLLGRVVEEPPNPQETLDLITRYCALNCCFKMLYGIDEAMEAFSKHEGWYIA